LSNGFGCSRLVDHDKHQPHIIVLFRPKLPSV